MNFDNKSRINTAATLMFLASVAVPNVASALELTFSRQVAQICGFKSSEKVVTAEFGVDGAKGSTPVTFGVNSNTGNNKIKINRVTYSGANLVPTVTTERAATEADFKIFVNGAVAADSMQVATAAGKTYSSDSSGDYQLWLTTTQMASKLKAGEQKVVMTIEADCS
ncbi:hypothetical protein [Photobacterium sanguinicancri]|uniref:hypothetical protein n=1 Tax=Photobacterium sanguinicancri TaxID=875932 RepID=UPI0021C330EA|nr:hypothetical protein [Photobacterium sanguinicancri]